MIPILNWENIAKICYHIDKKYNLSHRSILNNRSIIFF